jgi:hypothetical protein
VQISTEYEAAQRGLFGLASGASRHTFITQKMENMGRYQQELQSLVGEMPAVAMIAEHLHACTATKQRASSQELAPTHPILEQEDGREHERT